MHCTRRSFAALLVGALVSLAGPSFAEDGPYAKYDALLQRYVDERGMVDYAGFKAKDEAALRRCVAEMAKVDPAKLSKDAQKAYWINVYNAVTLQAMLEFWPLKSIKDKVSKLIGYNVWDDYPFGPKKRSLNDVEHKILRPMGDPRIHAAIVCASLGCPILRNRAYTPEDLDAQLDAQVRAWLKDRQRGLKLSGKTLYLSAIFDWFGEDFAKDEAGRLAWVARYAEPKVAQAIKAGGLDVETLDWDWAINAQ
jgi:hypothetical protein